MREIMKIMKILQFLQRIQNIIKILELHMRIIQIRKHNRFQFANHETYKNYVIRYEKSLHSLKS